MGACPRRSLGTSRRWTSCPRPPTRHAPPPGRKEAPHPSKPPPRPSPPPQPQPHPWSEGPRQAP
eukprot:804392-Alexandrium_andersonii.AAC.1